MSLDAIVKMAENLLIITAANAVITFIGTFSFLFIRDKIRDRKEKKKEKEYFDL
tara:strand:- start:1497 stop:1658 length:162 start_codon:yes stop_codon:yes gene_type:complete